MDVWNSYSDIARVLSGSPKRKSPWPNSELIYITNNLPESLQSTDQTFTDDTKLHNSLRPSLQSTCQILADDTKLHTSPTSHLILNIQITGLV